MTRRRVAWIFHHALYCNCKDCPRWSSFSRSKFQQSVLYIKLQWAGQLRKRAPTAVLNIKFSSSSFQCNTLLKRKVLVVQNCWVFTETEMEGECRCSGRLFHRHRYNTVKTVKSRTVSTGQKGSKSTYNCNKRHVNKETHCTKTKQMTGAFFAKWLTIGSIDAAA